MQRWGFGLLTEGAGRRWVSNNLARTRGRVETLGSRRDEAREAVLDCLIARSLERALAGHELVFDTKPFVSRLP